MEVQQIFEKCPDMTMGARTGIAVRGRRVLTSSCRRTTFRDRVVTVPLRALSSSGKSSLAIRHHLTRKAHAARYANRWSADARHASEQIRRSGRRLGSRDAPGDFRIEQRQTASQRRSDGGTSPRKSTTISDCSSQHRRAALLQLRPRDASQSLERILDLVMLYPNVARSTCSRRSSAAQG
jgi:hypothetical protein